MVKKNLELNKNYFAACNSCNFIMNYNFLNEKTSNGKSYYDVVFFLVDFVTKIEEVILEIEQNSKEIVQEMDTMKNIVLALKDRGHHSLNGNLKIDEYFLEELFFLYYIIKEVSHSLNNISLYGIENNSKFLKWHCYSFNSEFKFFESYFKIEEILIEMYKKLSLEKFEEKNKSS